MTGRIHPIVIAAMMLGGVGLRAQGPSPEIRARVSAFVAAVNGTADDFETMAQPNFTPAALSRRSAADRRQLFERLRSAFGSIQVDRVLRDDDRLNLRVKGSTGLEGTIALELEPDPPNRIRGLCGREATPATSPWGLACHDSRDRAAV